MMAVKLLLIHTPKCTGDPRKHLILNHVSETQIVVLDADDEAFGWGRLLTAFQRGQEGGQLENNGHLAVASHVPSNVTYHRVRVRSASSANLQLPGSYTFEMRTPANFTKSGHRSEAMSRSPQLALVFKLR